MSKLDDAIQPLVDGWTDWVHDQLDGTSYVNTELVSIDGERMEAKEHIKDLIRTLIDETFDKDDAKAYELWQKVEKL